MMVMAHLRFWYVSNGVSINLRPILGYDRFVHIVPSRGTILIEAKQAGIEYLNE